MEAASNQFVELQCLPHCFKNSRSDEGQGAVRKPRRARSLLRNRAVSGLERSYSRLSDLGFLRAFSYLHI